MLELSISKEERDFLRELAKQQRELSQLPIMKERSENWTKHNDLVGEKPMIYFEMWTVGDDGFNPKSKCTNEAAKKIEMVLLNNMCNHKTVNDDKVIPEEFLCNYSSSILPFGMPIKRVQADGIGFHIEPQIEDLDRDSALLKPSQMTFDKEGSIIWKNFVEEIIGDILPVRMGMNGFYVCMSNELVQRMSMENMFCAIMDTPDAFYHMMDKLSDDYVAYLKQLEKQGMLCLNNGSNSVAQGTFGFTTHLPSNSYTPGSIKTTDCWGFMDSQETVGVSPEMFNEFFFPHYKKVAEQFGLLSYGCCEPVNVFWEKSISKMPNLRKVSISPWCDEEYMGERLKGKPIIYQRKPSPNFIGVGKNLDEDAFRSHIKKTLSAAKGCKLEFTFRDVYNLDGNINKPRRAIEITREEIEKHWAG